MTKPVTQQILKAMLEYSPATGKFIWISKHPAARRIALGDEAGRVIQKGYIQIGIGGKYYLAHRLAFLYVNGVFPTDLVDHINGNPRDNRWTNLRIVTAAQNSQNAARSRKNSSGVTGVSWNIGVNKWVATIYANGKHTHLGCFDDLAEAAQVRKAAEQINQFHPNHGRP